MKKWQLQSNAFQAALKAMRAFKKAVDEATTVSANGQQILLLPLVMKFAPAPPVASSCNHCGCCQMMSPAGNNFPFCQNVQAPRTHSQREPVAPAPPAIDRKFKAKK